MKEKELLREIGSLVRESDGLNSALSRVQTLIASECGGALLILRPEASATTAISAAPAVCEFLESRVFPFRGLYVAPVSAGNRAKGTLVACIGTWGVPGELLHRITTFAGQQLTELARRLALPSLEYAEAA
ncbi:MAG: hypothetical protein JWN34_2123 [Bryobacterales bacterium]|nr:hypothetical protein [Bryobacterales bacterium]